MSQTARRPPGPGSLATFRVLQKHEFNYIKADHEIFGQFGDVARTSFPDARYLFFHPDHVRYFLKDNARNFHKSADYHELMPVLGHGLLTSEDEQWRSQRRLIGPEFQPQAIQRYGPTMVELTRRTIADWEGAARSAPVRDIAADMMGLAFSVAGAVFFGIEMGADASRVGECLEVALTESTNRMMSLVRFPLRWPTPKNRRLLNAVAELDTIVYRVIAEHQHDERLAEKRNILSRLLSAADADTGRRMEARLIRDEVMTMMLAGHETSSNALSWTLYLLARHPDIQEQVHDEVSAALGGREPVAADSARLTLCRQVLHESMRIYPPLPIVSRTPIEPDEIAGYPVAPGAVLTCVTAVIHMRPDFWPEPDQFRPSRWTPENAANIHPFSYLPFAAGPRECIGRNFAMLEMQLILAMLVQRFRFHGIPERPAEPFPVITLRPRDGVWLKLELRQERG